MAQRPKLTSKKRERERAQQQKQRDKEARRLEARQNRVKQQSSDSQEDPDIAGIKPGPQPLPDQWERTGGEDG